MVHNNGDASDYEQTPIGADSANVDRPDGSTAEENFVNIDNGVNIGRTLKYEDPYLYLLDGEGTELSKITLILPSHTHNYEATITKEATYTETGVKTYTCPCGHSYTEEIPMLVENINPTGTITIGDNTYMSLVGNPTFNTYFNTAQNVTIQGNDNESGLKSISYFVSDAKIDEAGLAGVAWTAYNSTFTIEPNRNAIVYAKIIDNQDNVTYICSDGIVLDNIAPVFNGMEDGGTYDLGTTLTLQDGETLFVNGMEVELTNNTYTFNVEDNYLLSITDRAGNESHINVRVEHVMQEYEKWDYTLDDSDNTITLNYYIGSDKNVTVYPQYNVGDKEYQTKINNNKDTNGNKNYMFSKNKNISSVIFKQGIDTSNVTSMNYMFNSCSSLTSLDLNSFNTSKVTNMYGMFQNCSLLTVLDLTSFDTGNVNNMSYMFYNCSKLKAIYVNENTWKEPISSLLRDKMFTNCGVSEVTYKDAA